MRRSPGSASIRAVTTFRRTSLLLAFMLATSPAYGQSTRKKQSSKKPPATSQPVKTTKAPPADDADGDESDEPRVFGSPNEDEETSVTPLVSPDAPAVAKPATPSASGEPAVASAAVTASGPVALFAVARTSAAEEAAVKLEDELLSRLKASGVAMVDLGAAFPPSPPASLTRADTLFEQGRTDYDNLDPESAEAKFLAAAEAYTKHPAELSPERLAKAYLFLGASRMLNGDSTGAQDAFKRAVVADPSTTPDAALFGQDVLKSFDQARADVKARPAGTLVVESKPAGASVLVRGQELGVTPLKGVEMTAGQHPVVVSLPGYSAFAQYTEVASAKSTEVKATLEPTPGLSAVRDAAVHASTEQSFERDTPPPEARAIGERLNARYVVLAAVARGDKGHLKAELQAWDLRSNARLRGVEIALTPGAKKNGPDAAADQVRAFVNGVAAPRVAEGGNSFSTLIKRPWFWAVVGGAAAVTAGAVYVATSQDKGRPFNPVSGGVGF
ncbi:PEGA domain-containing protein [Myxococcus xanthus]|uniref:PEGA domain-containing protein n=1 Tax=Myxococcus xanthus TaxID=34 RepID=A0AAE6FYL7_MYXXA|nr:PEGA domain-containing protein [Myxococcus xanthus]QDE74909.1 PEGA domain-containing protein [Myxococcus xanthus]